jgi:hypothetical protein
MRSIVRCDPGESAPHPNPLPAKCGARERLAVQFSYAAGTGSAVTDLIFSIAKREVTFLSETAPISFL